MQISFTKDAKTTNEINKKREQASNLFGLGLVSLIAACSSDDLNAGAGNDEIPIDDDTTNTDDDTTNTDDDTTNTDDDTTNTDDDTTNTDDDTTNTDDDTTNTDDDTTNTDDDTTTTDDDTVVDTPDPLPFEALTASDLSMAESGLMATAGGDTNSFVVEISDSTGAIKTLNFADGKLDADNEAKIYKLTDAEGQYDLVISSPRTDKAAGADYQEGKIFIYWDAANIVDESSLRLEITGATTDDQIGINAPEFLRIGGKNDNYDMVIRSYGIDKSGTGDTTNTGAIFILWDIADYHNTATVNHTVTLDASVTGATSGSLTIYGAKPSDVIGIDAPEFLRIGGKNDNYDMVIRSYGIDKYDAGAINTGAIYVLWDVADYYSADPASLHHTINLDSSATGATLGSLAIYGARNYDYIGGSAPEFLQLGGKDNNYDMVIRSNKTDKSGTGSAAEEGAIYILWDIVDYYNTAAVNHAIDLDFSVTGEGTGATSGSLAIYGAKRDDQIGTHAPEFLQLGGVAGDNKLDMVIRSEWVDKSGTDGTTNEGAIFILWDVADYHNTAIVNHTINLDASVAGATSGSLTIYGAKPSDQIGTHAPDFLQLGGKDDNYDMIIQGRHIDKYGAGGTAYTNEGAIFILWDVADYHNTAIVNHTINLDASVAGATSGSLTIYGAKPSDVIGAVAPEFLHIGGTDDNYDMVVGSSGVDKIGTGGEVNEGAIFILWDVEDYYSADPASLHHTINLDSSATGATSGSLAIHGARRYDHLGGSAPEFLQIGGKDDNYDMVIREKDADKVSTRNDEGAIYVLWDVEDYYSTDPANANKVIDLAVAADASSGLLTIYGKVNGENLGNDANNVLYGSDSDGNKALTNVDEGHADDSGKNDIVFQDSDYTYILFGDKVATTGGDTEIDSKTVDLSIVHASLTANTAGFFSYDFDGAGVGEAAVDRVGYRFADRSHTTLAEVQAAFPDPSSSPLSDTDSGLAVWDIA